MTIMRDMFQGMLLMLFFSYLLVTLRSAEPERRHLRAWFAVFFTEYDGYPHEAAAGFAPDRGLRSAGTHQRDFCAAGSSADGNFDCGLRVFPVRFWRKCSV